jgi:hypothetical protein
MRLAYIIIDVNVKKIKINTYEYICINKNKKIFKEIYCSKITFKSTNYIAFKIFYIYIDHSTTPIKKLDSTNTDKLDTNV